MKSILLLGTFDTKGTEYAFLREELSARGARTITIDAGILGQPPFEPDINRAEVARAAGYTISALVDAGDRGVAVEAMSNGAAKIVRELFDKGEVAGIVGLGGTGGTTLISFAMRTLPVGVPKLIVSTVASGDTRSYVGATDITMMYSVVDIAGINKISRRILSNAAGAIAGMAAREPSQAAGDRDRPIIAATMFGVTTPCVQRAREVLEEKGYEVLVFHATGTGGRSMEALADAGMFDGVLDITTTELADELVGGIFSAGEKRLTAAGRNSLPQVVSLGALDMVNFGPPDTVPREFAARTFYQHNASTTLMRTTPEECREIGRRLAERLSAGSGDRTLIIPTKGVSLIATEGKAFHDPVADDALITAIKENVSTQVKVVEVDTDINDPGFAERLAQTLVDAISLNSKERNA